MAERRKPAAVEARQIVRGAIKATLATIGNPDEKPVAGWPAASMVTVATAMDGSPILMLSTLSHHTQNLLADSRATLFYDATAGYKNPQQGPRVGVMGRIKPTKAKDLQRRFLAKHPRAALYAGFGDFRFYKMTVEKYHFVGGFARALWINKAKTTLPKAAWVDLAEAEEGIIDHMNADHAEALMLYGTKLLGKRGKHWEMVSVDPEGMDLRCGDNVHRLVFDEPVTDANACRKALVSLVSRARASK